MTILHVCTCMFILCIINELGFMVVASYKDSIVAILHIQNSIILIQTTEYNNFMRIQACVRKNTS